MLNIVVLNGGRGAATLIPALLRLPDVRLTSVVNAYDDGKSTGEIRRFFGMLGPSDIRKVQSLMLPVVAGSVDPVETTLFDFRFPVDVERDAVISDCRAFADGADALAGIGPIAPRLAGPLRHYVAAFIAALPANEAMLGRIFDFADCSLMNCLYAGAYLVHGRDIEATTAAIGRLFRLRGTVLPNSRDNRWLVAERADGELLACEADIVELRANVRIARLFLLEEPVDRARFMALAPADRLRWFEDRHTPVIASPGVRLALEQADIVIYAAGTQHSSLFPTYMSGGLAAAIADNRRALKVFVTNIGADYETPQYRAADFLAGADRFLRLGDARAFALDELFGLVLVNTSRIKPDETYVDYDAADYAEWPVPRVAGDFESAATPGRHDGDKLAAAILAHYERVAFGVGRHGA